MTRVAPSTTGSPTLQLLGPAAAAFVAKAKRLFIAKSLAGGFPLSGVIGRAAIMDAVQPGGLGGTYGGSPVGCAAALAVLDVIEEEGLVARASVIGVAIRAHLARLVGRSDIAPFSGVRAGAASCTHGSAREKRA